jgi:hypothetical protein
VDIRRVTIEAVSLQSIHWDLRDLAGDQIKVREVLDADVTHRKSRGHTATYLHAALQIGMRILEMAHY